VATMIAFLKAHKRAIVPGLALAWTAFQLIHPDVWGRLVDVSFFALFLLIIASQFFWFGRILDLGERLAPEKLRHGWLTAVAYLLYMFVFFQCIVVLGVVLSWIAFLLRDPVEWGSSGDRPFSVLAVMLLASQFILICRIIKRGERLLPGIPRGRWIGIIGFLLCASVVMQIYPWMEAAANAQPTRPATWWGFLIAGSVGWWLVGSWASFGLVVVCWTVDRIARGALWVYRRLYALAVSPGTVGKPDELGLDPPSPGRRRFLEQAATAMSALPFAATAYGLVFERVAFEVTRRSIRLARLPKAFEGFRIVQLSDIHISPFMPAGEIHHCVTMANALNADLVVMTGDYLADNAGEQSEVVQALGGLHAPHGVYGCLGNHEWDAEDSITRLFAEHDIHILRQERAPVQLRNETINLIGIDCPESPGDLQRLLREVEKLVMPDTVNILLTHYPWVFDRAVEIGIDLTLAGHTHGGQLSLEFLHRGLALSRFQSPYISGWYEKSGGQLYVNRGIGTMSFPIRFGARPEITVFELTRGA
jgi:predicted MPP superfamily phosphohydrolase